MLMKKAIITKVCGGKLLKMVFELPNSYSYLPKHTT